MKSAGTFAPVWVEGSSAREWWNSLGESTEFCPSLLDFCFAKSRGLGKLFAGDPLATDAECTFQNSNVTWFVEFVRVVNLSIEVTIFSDHLLLEPESARKHS